MSGRRTDRNRLVALTGRDPADAIVQATLVQQLRVLGVDPNDVVVAHASVGEPGHAGWFTDVRHCSRGSFVVRQLRLIHVVFELLRTGSVATVYARDVISMQVALVARMLAREKVFVIFDCRGDIAAEARLRGSAPANVEILRRMQEWSLRRADRTMVVSTALRRLVANHVPLDRVVVVPNLQPHSLPVVDEFRDRPLVVFAGGAQAWQDLPRVLKDLERLQRAGIDVEVITRDVGLSQKANELGFAVSAGGRTHVMARLQRATGSWMVRADAAANTVASPVKLGEALSAGAMVIGSQSTWEKIPQLVSDKLAIVVSGNDELERVVFELFGVWHEGQTGRARRLQRVQQKWTLQAYLGELEKFFGLKAGPRVE